MRRTSPGVGLGRRSVKAVCSPKNSLQPQTVTVGAEVGDAPQVDFGKHPPDLATGRMAALHGSPDRAFDNRVLLRLTRGRVFTANHRGVAKLHVVAAGEFSTVIRTEAAMLFMSATNFRTYVVVSDFFLIPHGRIHLEALSTNMIK